MRVLNALLVAAISLSAVGWGVTRWSYLRGCVDTTHQRPDAPQVFLQSRHVDLGTVPAGRPVVAHVPIRNDGRRRLIVRRDGGGCCGQADDAIIIAPGDASVLQTPLNTAGQQGLVHQTTTYYTNDRALPQFRITISANIAASAE